MRKMLKFKLICELDGMPPFITTLNHLNSEEWMGREPQTCKIKSFNQKKPVPKGEPSEFEILVEYRPIGCITFDKGGFWYDSWKLNHIDITRNGTLLDGHGEPLSTGENPVFLEWDIYHSTDYNNCEWGELIDEVEIDDSTGLQD